MGKRPAAVSRAALPLALLFLRYLRGIPQEDLARAARSTRGAISNYERGKQQPERRTLHRLLQGLGLPLSALEDTIALIVRLRTGAAGDTLVL